MLLLGGRHLFGKIVCLFGGIVYVSDHVEGSLWQMVMLALKDFLERSNCILAVGAK